MNLADVMDELGTALTERISDLRITPFWAKRITPPAAVVGWPDPLSFDNTFARGSDRFTIPVIVLCGGVESRTARDLLASYLDGSAPPAAVSFVGVGAGAANADSGAGVTLNPALPANIQAGDLLLCLASVRNADVGTVNTPSGWTQLHATNTNSMKLFGKIAVGGGADTPPAVTFTAGGTSITSLAQCAAFRGTSTNLATIVTATNVQSFGAAQNLPYATLTVPNTTDLGIRAGWKQDDWTSVAAVSNFTTIGEVNSTLGNDAAQYWDWTTNTTGWIGGSFVITGGAAAQSRALSVSLAAGSPPANKSVKYALEAHTYSSCNSVRVTECSVSYIEVGGVEYLAGTFDVDVIGRGA